MSATSRALANQRNAQLSTGPKTEIGKAASSRNATTHGLTSKKLFIAGEDPKQFEKRKRALYREYRPSTAHDKAVIDNFLICQWFEDRGQRAETAYFGTITAGSSEPYKALAVEFMENPAPLGRLTRYRSTISNAWFRAIKMLQNLLNRLESARYIASNAQPSAEPNGFVSPNRQLVERTLEPIPLLASCT